MQEELGLYEKIRVLVKISSWKIFTNWGYNLAIAAVVLECVLQAVDISVAIKYELMAKQNLNIANDY